MAGKSKEVSPDVIVQAIAKLSEPPPKQSYSAMYRSLTQPNELAQPQGAVDLGTVADIRQRASEEEPAQTIDLPSLSSSGRVGGGSGGGVAGLAQAKAAPKQKALTLDEQVALLQQDLSGQQEARAAAPVAVQPSLGADPYAAAAPAPAPPPMQPPPGADPYAGLGDVGDEPTFMGRPSSRRTL